MSAHNNFLALQHLLYPEQDEAYNAWHLLRLRLEGDGLLFKVTHLTKPQTLAQVFKLQTRRNQWTKHRLNEKYVSHYKKLNRKNLITDYSPYVILKDNIIDNVRPVYNRPILFNYLPYEVQITYATSQETHLKKSNQSWSFFFTGLTLRTNAQISIKVLPTTNKFSQDLYRKVTKSSHLDHPAASYNYYWERLQIEFAMTKPTYLPDWIKWDLPLKFPDLAPGQLTLDATEMFLLYEFWFELTREQIQARAQAINQSLRIYQQQLLNGIPIRAG